MRVCEPECKNHNLHSVRVAQWHHEGTYLHRGCGTFRQLYHKDGSGESRTEWELDGHHRGYVCGDFGKCHCLCACDRSEGQDLRKKPLHQMFWFHEAHVKRCGQWRSFERTGAWYGFRHQGGVCERIWVYRADKWCPEYPITAVWRRVSVFYHFRYGQCREYVGSL